MKKIFCRNTEAKWCKMMMIKCNKAIKHTLTNVSIITSGTVASTHFFIKSRIMQTVWNRANSGSSRGGSNWYRRCSLDWIIKCGRQWVYGLSCGLYLVSCRLALRCRVATKGCRPETCWIWRWLLCRRCLS